MIEIRYSAEVNKARAENIPLVALESTIITHGMPWPKNLEMARGVEQVIRDNGAIPATIAVIEGQLCIGLDDAQLEGLARRHRLHAGQEASLYRMGADAESANRRQQRQREEEHSHSRCTQPELRPDAAPATYSCSWCPHDAYLSLNGILSFGSPDRSAPHA